MRSFPSPDMGEVRGGRDRYLLSHVDNPPTAPHPKSYPRPAFAAFTQPPPRIRPPKTARPWAAHVHKYSDRRSRRNRLPGDEGGETVRDQDGRFQFRRRRGSAYRPGPPLYELAAGKSEWIRARTMFLIASSTGRSLAKSRSVVLATHPWRTRARLKAMSFSRPAAYLDTTRS